MKEIRLVDASLSLGQQPLSNIYAYGHAKPPEIKIEFRGDPNLPDGFWRLEKLTPKRTTDQQRIDRMVRDAVDKLTKAGWAYFNKHGKFPEVEFDESTGIMRLIPHKD